MFPILIVEEKLLNAEKMKEKMERRKGQKKKAAYEKYYRKIENTKLLWYMKAKHRKNSGLTQGNKC